MRIDRSEDILTAQPTFTGIVIGEQGVLCDCEVNVIVFNLNNGKLFEYSSPNAESILTRYANYNGPSERRKRDKVRNKSF